MSSISPLELQSFVKQQSMLQTTRSHCMIDFLFLMIHGFIDFSCRPISIPRKHEGGVGLINLFHYLCKMYANIPILVGRYLFVSNIYSFHDGRGGFSGLISYESDLKHKSASQLRSHQAFAEQWLSKSSAWQVLGERSVGFYRGF